jgi:hypothetical protein
MVGEVGNWRVRGLITIPLLYISSYLVPFIIDLPITLPRCSIIPTVPPNLSLEFVEAHTLHTFKPLPQRSAPANSAVFQSQGPGTPSPITMSSAHMPLIRSYRLEGLPYTMDLLACSYSS